ncbi:nuclease-related domain-containing protein [Bacillus suaedaesalsae]|uniref:NERD domain-containing protein n=1 Tax=Bacillus suaedaesalsae TaxID=2810349 RepID=A0ABS2DD41_9BACI|nr:nuclease-related domain-containing protein [Bacillus suaedaesalsae]MBM6616373.1 NERD domain-containing protein [Bacillus suaedaesalsae]
MIVKERNIPLRMLKLEALLRRLEEHHPKRPQILEELARRKAGYRGEQALEYYLTYLSSEKYSVLQDLRLIHKEHYFQIDTLILSPSYFLIVETKNYQGTIYFDSDYSQLIRTVNDKEEAFPSPLVQVRRQRNHLSEWIKDNKVIDIPIDYLVVISNPNTIIKASPKNLEALRKVTPITVFLNKIEQIEKLYPTQLTQRKEIQRISKKLIKKHTPLNPDLLTQFDLTTSESLKGVHCPSCNFLPMQRKQAKWICPKCSKTSKDAHVNAIVDYALLLDNKITNQKLREFLHISSRTVTNKILGSLALEVSGSKKGRVYYLDGLVHKLKL